jgi:predicted N-acetyltransferase YhbS
VNTSIRADAVVGTSPLAGSFVPSAHPRTSSPDSIELVAASPKDHAAIYRLLLAVFQGPTLAEYQAQLDAPRYDACDRLLIRRQGEIVAHVQTVMRTIHMGSLELPTMDLRYLATLPEYRSLGLGSVLLDGTMQEMRRAGVLVGTIRAKNPSFFRQRGWFPCNRYSYSVVNPRPFLAVLEAITTGTQSPIVPLGSRESTPKYSVQIWRRHEIDAIAKIFENSTVNSFGEICRLDSDWRWLVSREAYDRLYVVCDDRHHPVPEHPAKDVGIRPIVGYGVVRDSKLVEFHSQANQAQRIQHAILARICHDSLEAGRNGVEIHARPDHPIHDLAVRSGGKHIATESTASRVLMSYISRPIEFLQWLRPELRIRVQQREIPTHQELGIHTPDWQAKISIGTRSVNISRQRATTHYIETDSSTAGQILMGHLSPREAFTEGTLRVPHEGALDLAESLFPELPFWRPTLDDLTA